MGSNCSFSGCKYEQINGGIALLSCGDKVCYKHAHLQEMHALQLKSTISEKLLKCHKCLTYQLIRIFANFAYYFLKNSVY